MCSGLASPPLSRFFPGSLLSTLLTKGSAAERARESVRIAPLVRTSGQKTWEIPKASCRRLSGLSELRHHGADSQATFGLGRVSGLCVCKGWRMQEFAPGMEWYVQLTTTAHLK